MESNFRPVPSRSRGAAPYLGGKRKLAKRLCERIQGIPHDTYAEVFVGMAGVFLRRSYRPTLEVINDKNVEVATFFRMLEEHYQALIDYMKWRLPSRQRFDDLLAMDPDRMTDLQRAARFYYLQKMSFGGKSSGQSFGVDPDRPAKFNLITVAADLQELEERLHGVTIENLDYSKFLDRWDAAGTLFYLDPPYFGGETDYGKGLFEREDFSRMAEQLHGIEGAFLLSINDVPEIRELFGNFHIEEVRLKYSIASGDVTPAAELIISNREPTAGTEAGQGNLL